MAFHTAILTSTGQEWQFDIAIRCLVVKNDNFTLLLTSSGQEWQLTDLLADLTPHY